MITYIRKGKERKELMISRLDYTDGQCVRTFRVMVFPCNKNGSADLAAEYNEILSRDAAALAYHRILRKFKDDGWEVEAMK